METMDAHTSGVISVLSGIGNLPEIYGDRQTLGLAVWQPLSDGIGLEQSLLMVFRDTTVLEMHLGHVRPKSAAVRGCQDDGRGLSVVLTYRDVPDPRPRRLREILVPFPIFPILISPVSHV